MFSLDLEKQFRTAEGFIKEKLDADTVILKLESINHTGKLFFMCIVKIGSSTYLKTSKIPLSETVPIRPEFVINRLEPIESHFELIKAQRAIEKNRRLGDNDES